MLKKTLPYYVYQIDAIESWLDEQARSGLFLLDLRLGTMRFRQDTPKPMRYRIDVKRNRGYTGEKERIAAYAEMSWEYVCDLTPQLDIYCCADPDAPELNTDEETLHEVLDKKLTSEQRMGIIGLIFIPIWLYQMMFRNLLQGRDITGFYDFLTSPYVLLYPAILLLALYWLIVFSRGMRDAAATKKRLLLTRNYHCIGQERRRMHTHYAMLAMLGVCLLVCVILWIDLKRGEKNYPVTDSPLPTVTQVFPGHEEAQLLGIDPVRRDEMLFYGYAPLMRSTMMRQWGGEDMLDPSEGYRERTWYYNADQLDIAWEWVANGYVKEKTADMTPITVSGWEHAWFRSWTNNSGTPSQLLILQDGRTVWRIGYGDDAVYDLADALDKFAR